MQCKPVLHAIYVAMLISTNKMECINEVVELEVANNVYFIRGCELPVEEGFCSSLWGRKGGFSSLQSPCIIMEVDDNVEVASNADMECVNKLEQSPMEKKLEMYSNFEDASSAIRRNLGANLNSDANVLETLEPLMVVRWLGEKRGGLV
ncbi:Uncharacterized protein TCM_034553 [Theobroma cacao]|uniref:Uncharacterized protein n=1 Tax=Theobroma cacao TaxID=3641 RepID=A0A061FEN6_THECC|nr:Uncharacterized protein TCM_034553 [Theobroma cacao]